MRSHCQNQPTWLILAAILTAVGCGDATPYSVVPVTGAVTYEDGSLIPAAQIMLTFDPMAEPIDPKTHPRTAIGYVNVGDGAMQPVTTYKFGDGITAGKHRLLVIATDSNNRLLVPKEYTSAHTTPLIVDSADAPFQIKVPKP